MKLDQDARQKVFFYLNQNILSLSNEKTTVRGSENNQDRFLDFKRNWNITNMKGFKEKTLLLTLGKVLATPKGNTAINFQ